MRFDFSGTHVVMERGQHPADAPRRIEVCAAATGTVLATFQAGFNPRWLSDKDIFAESATGGDDTEFANGFRIDYLPANRGQIDANGAGIWTHSDLSQTISNGPSTIVADAREPRLSASGRLAARRSTGVLRIHGGPELDPCEDSRWSSETLVWWLGGRVWGRTTPDQSTVELTVPGRACSHPCPCWTGSQLFVGLVLDDGDLWVAEWSDLVARNGLGWPVGHSDGAGFAWDMRQDGGFLSICHFDALGRPVYVDLVLGTPKSSMLKPAPLPDQPFVVDPTGVVEDIADWLFSPNQGPDISFSPDGTVRFFLKSNEISAEGKAQGEHWDRDGEWIGHLDDASTGRRILDGKEVIAEDVVAMFPGDPHKAARVWATLALNHNWFKDGARLWMPRRCVSGTSIHYVTDIIWTVPPRETPHTNVWKNIPIEIRVDVGHGVIHGKEVRVRAAYIPDGHEEVNFYGPPHGYNAWIAGPVSWDADHWSAK